VSFHTTHAILPQLISPAATANQLPTLATHIGATTVTHWHPVLLKSSLLPFLCVPYYPSNPLPTSLLSLTTQTQTLSHQPHSILVVFLSAAALSAHSGVGMATLRVANQATTHKAWACAARVWHPTQGASIHRPLAGAVLVLHASFPSRASSKCGP
jgi:hypothetical protein